MKLKKIKTEPEFVTVYEYNIVIEAGLGIKEIDRKYRMTFTGKNYIPTMHSDEDFEKKFSCLGRRISVDDIKKLQSSNLCGNSSYISRYIYYLEGEEQIAKKMVWDSVSKEIERLKINADDMFAQWEKYVKIVA